MALRWAAQLDQLVLVSVTISSLSSARQLSEILRASTRAGLGGLLSDAVLGSWVEGSRESNGCKRELCGHDRCVGGLGLLGQRHISTLEGNFETAASTPVQCQLQVLHLLELEVHVCEVGVGVFSPICRSSSRVYGAVVFIIIALPFCIDCCVTEAFG